MGRNQRGQIYEAGGSFFVRYYVTEIVQGKTERVQRSHRLPCEKDAKHYLAPIPEQRRKGRRKYAASSALRRLADEFIATVNAQTARGHVAQRDMTVVEFWDQIYWPFAQENLRLSSTKGYEKIWEQHLKPHFGTRTVRQYTTVMGSELLTALAKEYGRNTIQHIRSLASGIFTHAVNKGRVSVNPWREVKVLGKVKQPEQTPHYTLSEIQEILNALENNPDGQLVMALTFFLGLRPSEVNAFRWENFQDGRVNIEKGFVRGRVDELKTKAAKASLPLIEPVISILKRWHEQSGSPSNGWLFPKKGTNEIPAGIVGITRRAILPALNDAGIAWKGLYAGRRGGATMLVDLTKGLVAAQELLRHKSMTTTALFYKKTTQNALPEGMKLLEASYAANGK